MKKVSAVLCSFLSRYFAALLCTLLLAPSLLLAQLSGTKTIGSGGDYATFTAAVAALTAQGISGPVTFNVITGQYTEQFEIGSVTGASAANTITFQSQSGVKSDVTLQYTPTSGSNWVVHLNQADYVTFQNMTLTAFGSTSYGDVVRIDGDANNNRLLGNTITGIPTTGASSTLMLVYADGDSIDNTVITGNTFQDGSYGVYLVGISQTVLSGGTQINNNVFTNQGYTPVYLYYHTASQVNGNTVTGNSTYIAIQATYCDSTLQVKNNKISLGNGQYGIYLAYCDGASSTHGLVANNFVSIAGNTTAYGITLYNSTNEDLYYNSVYILSTNTNQRALDVEAGGSNNNIVNNIFANQGGGYAAYVSVPGAIATLNYNDYYTTGNYVANWANADKFDLAALNAATGKDANSVSSFPNFTSGTDLHTLSPWVNAKGTPVASVTTDIDGNARDGSTPDIGADEFSPAGGTTTPLAGTYTVGAGGAYATFAAVRADLLLKGVSAPVTFNILNGTYNEQFELFPIPGASASNTVTFQSQSGNPANVNLVWLASGTSDNYIVALTGTDFVHFQNLTFSANTAPNAPYGTVFSLYGGVEDFRIQNSSIIGTPTGGGSTNQALLWANNSLHSSCTITGNTFTNGSYGIYEYGLNQAALSGGTNVSNNTFTDQGYVPVYLYYHNAPHVNNNTITGNSIYVAIFLTYCDSGTQVVNNKLSLGNGQYGIDVSYCDGASSAHSLIANNSISIAGNTTAYGLTLYNCNYQDVYYNSVHITSSNLTQRALDVEAGGANNNIVNNIFANQGGGYAAYVSTPTAIATSDRNDFYSTGNYLAYWTADRIDFAALKTASGKDANSVSSYPNFTSVTDLHTLSPWLNAKGTPVVSVTTDYDGNARNGSTPDIGAYEFTPDPSTTTPLSGTYTIGAGGNYATFADVTTDLLIKGISAPVTFNVLKGTYNEQMELFPIPGASSSNTITFQSQSGVASGVAMIWLASGASDNYVVRLTGTDFIRFQNMSFAGNTAPNSNYANVFTIFGGVEDFQFHNNTVYGTPTGSSSPSMALIWADNTLHANCTITGNTFTSGSYAVYEVGPSSTVLSSGTDVSNNTFTDQGYVPVYLYYHNAPHVNNNVITGSSIYVGIYLTYCDNGLQILNNTLTLGNGQYGIHLTYCDGTILSHGLIANNMIAIAGNTTAYGITLYADTYEDISYNSIHITSTNTSQRALDVEGGGGNNTITNNIFANQGGGYASYVSAPAAIATSNYNDFYSTGNYLAYWGADKIDLAALKSASGKDANSVSSYPNFTSATDLHTLSPWVNAKGTPLASVTTDFDGNARDGSTPDIGADEFTPNPSTTTPLSGIYTIGAGGSYPTFDAARTDLLIKGVSGVVTFNVLNGTYNEQMDLYPIPGASSSNTVTFEAQSGNAADATMSWIASGASDNYVVRLTGADYVRFQNMTFASNPAPNSGYAAIFYVFGGVEDLRVQNNALYGTPASGSTQGQILFWADNTLHLSRTITGNTFTNGSYGVYEVGYNTTILSSGTDISNNTFTNQGYDPIYAYYQNAPHINGNSITGNSTYIGIALSYCDNGVQVRNNKMYQSNGQYGIYLSYCDGTIITHGSIANNFISIAGNTTAYGITMYVCTYEDLYYNSVLITSTNTNQRALDIEGGGANNNIVNNIFANTGGGYAYVAIPTAVATSNYNDLYTTGTNIGYWNGDRTTFAAFKTASGKDANSVNLNPNYTATTNLHRATGALDSLATPLAGYTTDVDGDGRDPNKPDIGADERYPILAVPAISILDVSVAEGNSGTTNANFTLLLSAKTSQTVTVNYATANGTATTADSDYVATSGMVTFNSGDSVKYVSVTIKGDVKLEPGETFMMNLTNPSNATISDAQGVGTILNDDSQPTISINDVSVAEGNSGTTNAVFTATLSQVSNLTVTVNYATADGSATTANSDYAGQSGTLTFLPGVTTQKDTVKINGDTTNEPDETFFVNLSGAGNATIADNQGLGTIHNDDGVPAITVNDVSAPEGNSGTADAVFVFSLSTASTQTVTVNFATAPGTATAGVDYASKSGTITFNPGVTLQRDTIKVNGDLLNESDETFFVNLTSPANATIGDAQGTGVITDDDALPVIGVNDVSVAEGNSGTSSAQFTVRLSPASGRTVTVNYATGNGTATSGSDYASASGLVTFNAGDTAKQVNVSVNGDVTNEPDETLYLNLSGASNATISDAQGIGTILNDDVPGANLSLSKSDSPDPVYINAPLTYTISITNAGPDPAANVVVLDTLPLGVSYQSGVGTGWTVNQAAGIVTCTRASLAVGSAPDITITVTAPSSAGTISNAAVVTSSTSDNNLANNRDVEQTTVVAGIDLSIAKLDSPDPVTAGGTLTYTLNVSNSGPATASLVVVRDVLPAGVTCVSASGTGWDCLVSSGIVTCTRATLASGSAPPITIIGTAPPNAGIISNTATVSASGADPVMTNNSATAATTVNPVLSATDAIDNLIRQAECMLAGRNTRPFIATLQAAKASLARGNKTSAANQMEAFINKVNAILSPTDAAPLLASATAVIGMINQLPGIDPAAFGRTASLVSFDAAGPEKYDLSQNYPNPFNPSTSIQFSVMNPGRIKLIVYDVLGEERATLVDGDAPTGNYEIRWDAGQLESGIYFYRFQTNDFVLTKKLILIK